MAWLIGVDVGGTFTDFCAFDGETGAIHVHKTPSTPDNPALAVIDGLLAMQETSGIDLAAVDRVAHGTTVATNALIQKRGGSVALITTGGFRDLLEIGRQIRPHMYDFQTDHPPPLVPRERRFEISERVMANGDVLRDPAGDEIADAVKKVAESGADACAVCFLFSFVNPDHERRLRDALRATVPHVFVSVSSEVQPEFREYERLSTTVMNAYLQPLMTSYLTFLEDELAALAPSAAVGINQSSGGLMSSVGPANCRSARRCRVPRRERWGPPLSPEVLARPTPSPWTWGAPARTSR